MDDVLHGQLAQNVQNVKYSITIVDTCPFRLIQEYFLIPTDMALNNANSMLNWRIIVKITISKIFTLLIECKEHNKQGKYSTQFFKVCKMVKSYSKKQVLSVYNFK